MNDVVQWLLRSEPYIRYRTRLDLLGQPEDHPEVRLARAAMLAHPMVRGLLADLSGWPGGAISSHKKADLLIHKLAFLAEIGVARGDPGVDAVLEKIMAHLSEQNVPELLVNIPTVFGGSGADMWAWMLCDTPRLYFSLSKMGVMCSALSESLGRLAAIATDIGWPCAASPEAGRFKGPGRKTDPCPYATLLMLSALLQTGDKNRPDLRAGAECLLHLWEHSREEHPFLFHMGTDFRKLKAPFIWYDILHVTDVLSQMNFLRGDPRIEDMLDTILSKADSVGCYTPESVWTAWKEWDFGQKKQPSPWLTFLVLRILQRTGKHDYGTDD
jgi:hypothetical protein